MTDREKFLSQARTYIGKNGNYVCNTKLHLGWIDHWCAFSVSAIMQDCGFIGKYIKKIEGGAGSIPRESDGKYGKWFKKGIMVVPQAGDLFFLRYADYPNQDKYFCDHVGIVEAVNGNAITTLEGNVDGQNSNWARTSVFKRKTRYLDDNVVYAFYRPNWSGETKTTSTKASKQKEIPIYQLTSSAESDYIAEVTATDGLNIRQGAATSYKILGAVPYRTMVNVTRETSGGGHIWGLVEYKGTKGWIALTYTKKRDLDELAKAVIAGKYGNGDYRKVVLGNVYGKVQKRVNEMLK